jgi:vacuolar-type H+-ATPase subunit F/Vma7
LAGCAFLGDAVTALGFRLAGVECHVPGPGETPALFQRLCGEAALVLITAETAAALPAGMLRETQRRAPPLVLVIPDIRARVPALDRSAALRRRLGIGE